MACVLYFLVSMAVLKLSHSYNSQLPPYWGWYRHYDIDPSFEVTASSYRFPLTSQTLHIAPLHEVYSIEETDRPSIDCCRVNTRTSQDTRDYRVNERSIANSHIQNVQNVPYVRINEPIQSRSENGSSKILNNFLKPARRRGQIDRHPITFPGPTESSFRSGYEPEIPESCRNSTYCEDVLNYPQDEIDKYILELGDTVQFQLDKLDVPDTPDINQRVGPFEDNVELCHYEEKVVYPKTAQGADGKWYSLLNRKENPVQGYRVEICNFSGGTGCANIAIFQQGYEASCKQKYVYRTAAAFEKVGDGIRTFETEVKLPSCCSCSAKLSLR